MAKRPSRASVSRYRDPDDKIYLKIDIEKVRNLVEKILNNEEYQRNLIRRAKAGVLAPAVEIMLWHYMFGKPTETVDVNVTDNRGEDLTKLTDEELAERARQLPEKILNKEPPLTLSPPKSDPTLN